MTRAQLNRQIMKAHVEARRLSCMFRDSHDTLHPARIAAHELAEKALDLWALANPSPKETKR